MKPNLFIVGQPKSGTTALHQFLGQHPEIYMSSIKEPHFFCSDFHLESDLAYGKKRFFDFRSESAYLQLFAKAEDAKVAGESSTNYLYSQVAAEKIHNFNPDAKIIIILREPAKFLYSLHSHYVKFTEENEPDFLTALALEEDRIAETVSSPRVTTPSYLYYDRRVQYYQQVKRYCDRFKPEQMKVIVFEEFQSDNQSFYREILEFLGVDPNFIPEYETVNTNKEVKFKAINKLVNSPLLKNISKNLLSQEFNEFIRDNIVEKFLWHQAPKTSIPEAIKIDLMEKYQPQVARLSELVDIDFETKWGYDKL
ncbi:sulfotransferase [Waterburya agarophytonicola K14]|uniref:Sulfotransferase n=1 Tax=Waterburya agarophytonicola KI4 TaxID=2874699 RepID=A0A964FE99_9CYAN|nr:sulfotransferase [Waterburya agarophytonicola]MCC0175632.1 sulfotransferase [Waterburya agarophytonicola KI4]